MQVFARELYNAALRAGARVVLGLGVRKIVVEDGRVRAILILHDYVEHIPISNRKGQRTMN